MSDYYHGPNHPASDHLAQYYYGTIVLMRDLIRDMHALLQRCCDETNMNECSGQPSRCAMWSDPNDDCDLRKIEERMRTLGIEVRE